MKFLAGSEISEHVREAAGRSSTYDLAVAFWGADGATMAGISSSGKVRIICDAFSGCCNPKVLSRLVAMPNVEVKTRDGLHSKVYLTERSAIVGSANASANGLGGEGVEAGTIEAAVQFDEPDELAKLRDWFEKQWADTASERITKGLIKQIVPIWKRHRATRPPIRSKSSLLDTIRTRPELFVDRPARLVFYSEEEASAEAISHLSEEGFKLYSADGVGTQEIIKQKPLYEDDEKWDVEEGDYIIDYNKPVQGRKMAFTGIWQVIMQVRLHKSWLTYVKRVDEICGFEFSKADQIELGNYINNYISNNRDEFIGDGESVEMKLNEIAKFFSM